MSARAQGRPAGTYTQTHRVLDIRALLLDACPAAVSLRFLADRVHVTTRTVRRDLEVLEQRREVRKVEDKPTHWRWCARDERKRAAG